MFRFYKKFFPVVFLSSALFITACGDDEPVDDPTPQETDFTDLLSNQINEVIIPCMISYEDRMNDLVSATQSFATSMDAAKLSNLRTAYQQAYISYQAVAVHHYFATANQALVQSTNLYPVDTALLASFISNRYYNFSTQAQQRANGFPAIDFLLYGPSNVISYFNTDTNRIDFLEALVISMQQKAVLLASQWQGSLKENFINNGGVALGSSVSVQLNESISYYEDHVRENKVGLPIGRIGPNDSPIAADPTIIEGYYQSLYSGNEDFTFALLKRGVEEMENIYLGKSASGINGQGYDDILSVRNQNTIDSDIKAVYQAIYDEIDTRSSISGDESLYQDIQALVTIYKSDLLPILNVQDADGINDGD